MKDGHTLDHRGDLGKSGCEVGAGGSFMCANQQPWAVNDHLAYGFAAAHVKNEHESNWYIYIKFKKIH